MITNRAKKRWSYLLPSISFGMYGGAHHQTTKFPFYTASVTTTNFKQYHLWFWVTDYTHLTFQYVVTLRVWRSIIVVSTLPIGHKIQCCLKQILSITSNFRANHFTQKRDEKSPWWCHQMETFSALLALCAGNSPVTGEFPSQRPVTRSFGVFFDLRLNEYLSKQWWSWRFETPICSLWRHGYV